MLRTRHNIRTSYARLLRVGVDATSYERSSNGVNAVIVYFDGAWQSADVFVMC